MISLKEALTEASNPLFKYNYEIYPREWNDFISFAKDKNKKIEKSNGEFF